MGGGGVRARTGTHCQLDVPRDDVVIDQEAATALFRIFQATLTNVARHANATEVNVRLAKELARTQSWPYVLDAGLSVSDRLLNRFARRQPFSSPVHNRLSASGNPSTTSFNSP